MQRWLASPKKGLRVDRETETLELSRVFDWFAEDFEPAGGVLAFVTRYAPAPERAWLEAHSGRVRIRYLGYDWALNALAPSDAHP
jgi:hypothetical protein